MTATFTWTPTNPTPGQDVGVIGSGYPPSSLVYLTWDKSLSGQAFSTDSLGGFTATIKAPATAASHILNVSRIVTRKTVTVKAPVQPPPIPPTGSLLSLPQSARNTEIPYWLDTNDPIFNPTSGLYLAMKNHVQPKIGRWMPGATFADGLTISFVQKVCRTLKDWGSQLWIKGPTHGSSDPAHQRYCMPKYSAAYLIEQYSAIYEVCAAEFPGGFFIEHQNEVDLCADQAAGGALVADHWNQVAVPVRKAFAAKHPNCGVVWVLGSLTNFGGPRWGDKTPYMEPVDAIWTGVKDAYAVASAADKPFYIPHVFSYHAYLSDFTVHQTSPLSELDPAIDYLGLVARTFKLTADATFPGAGIRIALSEWNSDQSGNQHDEWPARTAYAYPRMEAMAKANGIWQSIQFVASGDSRTATEALTGCPDMVATNGDLINGGVAFCAFS